MAKQKNDVVRRNRKTKILATIGPASDSIEKITAMYKAGMRIARLNFSHGDHEYFRKVIKKNKCL